MTPSLFTAARLTFGAARPQAGAVPAPVRTREARRRFAQLAEARDALTIIPEPGEAVHCVLTGRYDFMDAVSVLIEKLGTIDRLTLATLAFARRNLVEMLRLFDTGAVKALTVLVSAYFKAHNPETFQEALDELRARGQRAAAARCHAKVLILAAATGARIVAESSANLRANGNIETATLFHDAALAAWHEQWISERVNVYAEEEGAPRH